MDPAALAGRLEAIDGRLIGTDAERRAALLCARELRDAGRRPRVETLWLRPRRALALALWAAAGVAASVVAVESPEVGLMIAGGAAIGALAEAAGLPLAALLQRRRATQNVVVAPRAEKPVRLVIAASLAAPRDGLLRRAGRLPPPIVLLLAGLAGVAACAAVRTGGADGTAIGVAQLLPSVLLIAVLGALLDAELAGPARPPTASGVGAAIAVAAALEAAPPQSLAVELVLAGGEPGLRAHVARHLSGLRPEEVVVLMLGPGTGPLRHATRHGRLRELAAALPGAEASKARRPRFGRRPAIALRGEPRALAAAALRLTSAIDREVAQGGARQGR